MTFASFIDRIISITTYLVPLLVGASVLVFLWGLFIYMTNAGDSSQRQASLKYMLYGIIGLFVMISMWALAFIFSDFFGLEIGIPQITV